MSFQEEKRENIKRYMLEKIRQDDELFVQKTMDNFQISVTTVKRYIKECLDNHIICEDKEKKTKYALITRTHHFKYVIEKELCEDKIFYDDIAPVLPELSRNAMRIWSYCFMEMMNNALEHSNAEKVSCNVKSDHLHTEISIIDDGIGIFSKVKAYLKEMRNQDVSFDDVKTELYKGKLTTASANHSGEGIFFTSKILNEFAIWSDNTILSYGCTDKEKLVQSHLISYFTRLNDIGTMVVMKLENATIRRLEEVFDMFAPIDEGFIKTRIPIKEVCPHGEPIARSQARRIANRLEEFKKVELDFQDVEFMGQGFADEMFRVFQNEHPEVELIPINACRTVLGMISHVKKR